MLGSNSETGPRDLLRSSQVCSMFQRALSNSSAINSQDLPSLCDRRLALVSQVQQEITSEPLQASSTLHGDPLNRRVDRAGHSVLPNLPSLPSERATSLRPPNASDSLPGIFQDEGLFPIHLGQDPIWRSWEGDSSFSGTGEPTCAIPPSVIEDPEDMVRTTSYREVVSGVCPPPNHSSSAWESQLRGIGLMATPPAIHTQMFEVYKLLHTKTFSVDQVREKINSVLDYASVNGGYPRMSDRAALIEEIIKIYTQEIESNLAEGKMGFKTEPCEAHVQLGSGKGKVCHLEEFCPYIHSGQGAPLLEVTRE